MSTFVNNTVHESDSNDNSDSDEDTFCTDDDSSQWETETDDSDDIIDTEQYRLMADADEHENPAEADEYGKPVEADEHGKPVEANEYGHIIDNRYIRLLGEDYARYQNHLFEEIKENLDENIKPYFTKHVFDIISDVLNRLATANISDKQQHARIIFNNIANVINDTPLQYISLILIAFFEQDDWSNLDIDLNNAIIEHHELRLEEFIRIDNESITMHEYNDGASATGTIATLNEFTQRFDLTIDDDRILGLLDGNMSFNSSVVEERPIIDRPVTIAMTAMTREETDNLDRCSAFDITFRDGDERTCKICHDDLTDADIVTRISCQHLFHHNCLRVWLENRFPCCPICRKNVNE